MANTASRSTSAKEVVMNFVKALNAEDFKTARSYAHDQMKFIGVIGQRDGADAYFQDMERMKLKYDIKKAFADENDVCILYEMQMSGLTIFGCGWYKVDDAGLITS